MAEEVPELLAAAVEGAWELGPAYRVEIIRDDDGLRVHQEVNVRLRGPVSRDARVHYDSAAGTLAFAGVGAVHRVEIHLRPSGDGVEFRVRSEIAPDRWLEGTWEPARRGAGGPR